MNPCRMTTIITAAVLFLASLAYAQTGGGYDLTWSTIDGGGGTSTGGGYSLSGTIGQPDANSPAQPLSGGNYELAGGFWVFGSLSCTEFAPFDFDQDCDVDLTDFLIFQMCAQGPEIGHHVDPDCPQADIDQDGDIDSVDFGAFQNCLSGSGSPADPQCAD